MNERELISAIVSRVHTYALWALWTIGITNDPDRRKNEHKKDGKRVGQWKHWKAD